MNELDIQKRLSEDGEVLSEIIDAYEEKLTRYISRITDISDIERESLLEDIFIKVYRYIHEYDSRYAFSSWIYRIAHNMVIDYHRKHGKENENISLSDEDFGSIIESLTDGNSPHQDLKKSDIKSCVQRAIWLLRQEYREIILLKCIEGYSYEEISDILSIPVWSASTLVNRARKELKIHLEKLHCQS